MPDLALLSSILIVAHIKKMCRTRIHHHSKAVSGVPVHHSPAQNPLCTSHSSARPISKKCTVEEGLCSERILLCWIKSKRSWILALTVSQERRYTPTGIDSTNGAQ